jgi:molybdenum cofactor cytidylyltransferase
MIGGLVLAAGAGTRFGGRKQLADVAGRPLLDHVLDAMGRAPLDRVVVVLGDGSREVLEGVDLQGARAVLCERWRDGQSASLRAGVDALADCRAAVIALGDQPLLSPQAVERLLRARDGSCDAVRATYDGVPGHPVVIERALFARVRRLGGDVGARAVLSDARVLDVPCDGLGLPDDVDTPEQLEATARIMARRTPDPVKAAMGR